MIENEHTSELPNSLQFAVCIIDTCDQLLDQHKRKATNADYKLVDGKFSVLLTIFFKVLKIEN